MQINERGFERNLSTSLGSNEQDKRSPGLGHTPVLLVLIFLGLVDTHVAPGPHVF